MYITKPVSEQFRSRANVCVVYVRKTYTCANVRTSVHDCRNYSYEYFKSGVNLIKLSQVQVKQLFLDTRTMGTIVNHICESFISWAPGRSPSDKNCGLDRIPRMVYFY